MRKKPTKKNVFFLYKYGEDMKLVLMSGVPYSGLENSVNIYAETHIVSENEEALIKLAHPGLFKEDDIILQIIERKDGEKDVYKSPRKEDHSDDERLENSISRSKSKIREYVICNNFKYCVTLTFKPEKQFFNLDGVRQFLDAFRKACKRRGIKYLLVPEICEKGQFHFHGFLTDIPEDEFFINEHRYPDWTYWRENFGFCSIDWVGGKEDKEKKLFYILKYLQKGLASTIKEKGAHLYYSSKGLNQKELIYKGYGFYDGEWDFVDENEFAHVKILDKEHFHDFITIDGEIFDI